jgi:protein-L-isoaspartate(D-aspartate) O-methyltransferase
MVLKQLERRGIADQRVLDAMREVERETFIDPTLSDLAYSDRALPIECEQTISQPYTVAFMSEAARTGEHDKVLEIGTGSGYGAAVLSKLVREVHTVERIPSLAELAAERLERLGYANVHVHVADGTLGLADESPFNAIVVTAGAKRLPRAYVDQLCPGGRIVIPLGNSPRRQLMHRFTWSEGELIDEQLGGFVFVPLIGKHGWKDA